MMTETFRRPSAEWVGYGGQSPEWMRLNGSGTEGIPAKKRTVCRFWSAVREGEIADMHKVPWYVFTIEFIDSHAQFDRVDVQGDSNRLATMKEKTNECS